MNVMLTVAVLSVFMTVAPETELSRLETAWNDAHLRGDADALDRLCADDLVVIVPGMRVFNKSEAIGTVRSGHIKFDRYQTSDTRIRMYDNAAVVTGRLQRTRTIKGQAVNDDWRFTKVYVRHPEGWRVVSFHASTTPP